MGICRDIKYFRAYFFKINYDKPPHSKNACIVIEALFFSALNPNIEPITAFQTQPIPQTLKQCFGKFTDKSHTLKSEERKITVGGDKRDVKD